MILNVITSKNKSLTSFYLIFKLKDLTINNTSFSAHDMYEKRFRIDFRILYSIYNNSGEVMKYNLDNLDYVSVLDYSNILRTGDNI